jgi:DNA-directed RNA polymerase specialized sigma24 family protein
MMTAMGVAEPAASLADLYREHYRALVKLATLLVDDVGTCEEIVQDAFVAVHRRRPDDPSKLPAYLRSAVLNGARGHLRRQVVRRRPLAAVPYVTGTPPGAPGFVSGTEAALDFARNCGMPRLKPQPFNLAATAAAGFDEFTPSTPMANRRAYPSAFSYEPPLGQVHRT